MNLTFGEKIKEARKLKGFTQKQLAIKIGAKHNSISDWENNKNKPDPDTIELLCGVLDITPNYLLAADSTELSPVDKLLIKKYRTLDDYGKDLIDTILNKEYSRCTSDIIHKSNGKLYVVEAMSPNPEEESNVKSNSSCLEPVAAHERSDIEITDEMRKHDDDIMNDDDFWNK